ncbi:MAG: MATE family efflux transporter [Lachnospiraceae bacterium]
MIGFSGYILVDTFFISNGVGAAGLASLNLVLPAYNLMYGCGLMISIGSATKYSILQGQKNTKNSDLLFTNTIYLGIFFSIIFLVAGIFFSEEIVFLLGANNETFLMANSYMKILFLFSPMFLMNNIFTSYVKNDGEPKLVMIAMLSGSLVNVIFDYIFIYPMKMGMVGAALATGFSPITSMLILSIYKIKNQNKFHFTKAKIDFSLIKIIFSLGISSFITEMSNGIVIIVFNYIILGLTGNIGVAAYGVVANLSLVVMNICTGIAQGSQPLFSLTYGYGDRLGTKKILRYALTTMAIVSVVIYSIFFIWADSIVTIFNSTNNLQLQSIATIGLKLYFISILFAGFNIIMSMFLNSVNKPKPAQIISLLRGFIIIIPASYLLAKIAKMIGVWLAFPTTEFIVAIVGVVLFFKYRGDIFKNIL